MRDLDAAEREHQHELCQADQQQGGQRYANRREHEQHDGEGEHELEDPAVGVDSGKLGREDVVDHERNRVRQVEEVRNRPNPAVDERRSASSRCLHERGQPSGRDDAP